MEINEGNIQDTATILLARFRQSVADEDAEMRALKRLNDMYRFCTGDFMPIGEVGKTDFETFKD
jgi:hypothetical protein